MIIKKLEVAGLRAFEYAEFEFQPGMNLLVGVNGVGKTTVLDALRICLSRVLPEITKSNSPKLNFETSDIKVGYKAMKISCDLEFGEQKFNILLNKQLESVKSNITETPREASSKKRSREMREILIENKTHSSEFTPIENPDIEIIQPELKNLYPNSEKSDQQPIGVFYSTRRSFVVDQKVSTTSAAGGQEAAYAESFSINRNFNLKEFAEWFKVQEALAEESPIAIRRLEVLREAVKQFLPGCHNLHVVVTDKGLAFKIEKNEVTLNISQLSDGERSILTMVLDLARRLAQANPGLEDPLKEGKGIVLIDELDLHLHPKWQRTIVEHLTSIFLNCQFIATSHSPQIIPSVEPEHVLLLKDSMVIHPDRTLGMDTNWILRNIMDTNDSPRDALIALKKVEDLIAEGFFEAARNAIAVYIQDGLDRPEWAIFEARMARFETFNEEE